MSDLFARDRRFSKGIVLAVVLLAIALVIPAGLVRASGGEGTIRGVITDSGTHAPIANATVQVTAADVNWIFHATTNPSGSYAIALPNHLYTVEVSASAYYLNSTTVPLIHAARGFGYIVKLNHAVPTVFRKR